MYGKSKYAEMSDEKLRTLAQEKYKNTGCYKRSALAAQRELWERNHWETNETIIFDDGFSERSIEDIQYNG